MFTGVELEPTTVSIDGLEFREIIFAHYAYWKHVGPYAKLKDVHQSMERELSGTGLTLSYPRVEIYGHWTEDESALETEVLITLK